MIKLKHILFEEDSTDVTNPNTILVKNKKSGEKYTISKKSYDPELHTKLNGDDVDTKTDKEKTTALPSEKKLTPIDFISKKEQTAIVAGVKDIRPDLKNKLLNYGFNDWFRDYDGIMVGVTSDKPEITKDSTQNAGKILKKTQAVSIAKHSVINTFKPDKQTVQVVKEYRGNAIKINNFLRDKISLDKDNTKRFTTIVKKMDEYFKNPDSQLEYNTVVYRGVDNDVLPIFLKKKSWKDDGFVSTSMNPFITEKFGDVFKPNMRNPLFRMLLKKGTPVLMLSCDTDEFCGETEITLPRGCKFSVASFNETTNVCTLNVEFPNA